MKKRIIEWSKHEGQLLMHYVHTKAARSHLIIVIAVSLLTDGHAGLPDWLFALLAAMCEWGSHE